ncbi:MAG: hypothetical protein FJ303_19345 [Planctomycetes bacterium]|nr:hypothetical protein [Planctomycetota bacterium]
MKESPDSATGLARWWLWLPLAGLAIAWAIDLGDGFAGSAPPARKDAKPLRAVLDFAPAESPLPRNERFAIVTNSTFGKQVLEFTSGTNDHGRVGFVTFEFTESSTPKRAQVLNFAPAERSASTLQTEPPVPPRFPIVTDNLAPAWSDQPRALEMRRPAPAESLVYDEFGLARPHASSRTAAILGFRANDLPILAGVAPRPAPNRAAAKTILVFEPSGVGPADGDGNAGFWAAVARAEDGQHTAF